MLAISGQFLSAGKTKKYFGAINSASEVLRPQDFRPVEGVRTGGKILSNAASLSIFGERR